MPKNNQSKASPDKSSQPSIKAVDYKVPSAFTVQAELEAMNEKLNAIGEIATQALRELIRIRFATRPFQKSDLRDWDACDKWVKAASDEQRAAANTALVEQARANQAQMRIAREQTDGE